MRKKAAFHNLGCKVNSYETEAMQQLLEQNNYEIVPFAPGADVYIINTCTVTNIADRKSRQMLHKAKKMNPHAVVVAVGCYVQAAGDQLEKDEAVDLIIGNNKKNNLVEILQAYERDKEERYIEDLSHTREYEPLSITRTAEHTRAYIKVQDGCNQFCSYCIIPYARGRVRSRELEDVIGEVKGLAQAGFKEVVLTGIHLSSYGIDKEGGVDLLALIQAVHQVDGIKRIRLGSLEPRIITEEFALSLASMEKICPHFHLSLQSGCDATLKRMNRRYDTAEYLEKCHLLRRVFPNPALTTDVIAGFPGETEEEFKETEEYLKEICFYETHIFKYSRRKGTKAADMENQVRDEVKTRRSNQLLELNRVNQKAFEESFIGKEVEVLWEESIEINGQTYMTGHTREYIRVAAQGENIISGQCSVGVPVKLLDKNILLLDNQNIINL